MSKDTTVRSRVDSRLQADAETILNGQSITMSQAINLMLRQVVIKMVPRNPFLQVGEERSAA